MQIISDFKDYYDFIAHQNVDKKIVYVRHCVEYKIQHDLHRGYRIGGYQRVGSHRADMSDLTTITGFGQGYIHVCGTQYYFCWHAGRFLYDLAEIRALIIELNRNDSRPRLHRDRNPLVPYANEGQHYFEDDYGPQPSKLNQALNAPVVLDIGNGSYYADIRLASINFGQAMPPEQLFMQLYNFLIPKEIEPDMDPDNMNRYAAKGFDRKTSFRKDKKT
jgi:hypothetical protein